MQNNNYHIRLEPKKLPADLWQTILNIPAWWAQETEGIPQKFGDHFTVHFGTTWATFLVQEINAKKMIWNVSDSYLDLLADSKEWNGTRLIFELTGPKVIEVTHEGLTPEKECFSDCQKGWDFFLGESLMKYLEDAQGLPANGIHAWLKLDDQVYRGKMYSPDQQPSDIGGELLLLDVKATKGEQILTIHGGRNYDGQTGKLAGKYYALFPNEPGLLEKLQQHHG